MENIKVQLIKFIAHKFGYKIAMVKIDKAEISIQGDKELLRYCDIVGYTWKKEPLKRTIQ